MKHFQDSDDNQCPICGILIHETNPFEMLRYLRPFFSCCLTDGVTNIQSLLVSRGELIVTRKIPFHSTNYTRVGIRFLESSQKELKTNNPRKKACIVGVLSNIL